jgi:hypothetical protein
MQESDARGFYNAVTDCSVFSYYSTRVVSVEIISHGIYDPHEYVRMSRTYVCMIDIAVAADCHDTCVKAWAIFLVREYHTSFNVNSGSRVSQKGLAHNREIRNMVNSGPIVSGNSSLESSRRVDESCQV